MNDLLKFKRNAVMLGLCGEYKSRWDSAKSKQDLMDIALDANGVEMLCDAAAFGWGMDIQYMKNAFSEYINGNWKRKKDGYTSCLYVLHDGVIEQECTITAIISCNGEFHVPKGKACKLYVSGDSNINVTGEGDCYVYLYGDCKVTGNRKLIHCYQESLWVRKAAADRE